MTKLHLRVLAVALTGSLVTYSASAMADGIYRGGIKDAPYVSWSGFYAGLGIGTRTTDADVSVLSAKNVTGGVTTNLLPPNCFQLSPCVPGQSFEDTAFRFSPYVGWNVQLGSQWVAGIEGDWGWGKSEDRRAGEVLPGGGFPFYLTGRGDDSFTVKTNWDASLRARLGFLVTPSTLLYATGGVAWLGIEQTSVCGPTDSCTSFGFRPNVINHSDTLTGWTIGGGMETMLWRNWLLRAEYRYADFGSITNTDVHNCCGGGATTVQTAVYDSNFVTHTWTLGLAYKF
jgi:outer membrane immunogenic protein